MRRRKNGQFKRGKREKLHLVKLRRKGKRGGCRVTSGQRLQKGDLMSAASEAAHIGDGGTYGESPFA